MTQMNWRMTLLCVSQHVFLSLFFCADCSDWQQTDAEDQRSNKSQPRGSEHAQTTQPGQTKHLGNSGNPTVMLPPIYIINNMVLKQVRQVQVQAVRIGKHTLPMLIMILTGIHQSLCTWAGMRHWGRYLKDEMAEQCIKRYTFGYKARLRNDRVRMACI